MKISELKLIFILIQLFEMYGVRRVESYEGRKFRALFLINHILESAANHLRKV